MLFLLRPHPPAPSPCGEKGGVCWIVLKVFLRTMVTAFRPLKVPARKHKVLYARELRKSMTPAETLLWKALKGRGCAGVKFRRQVGIRDFVVDFCSLECRLIIEVDGGIHDAQQQYDAERDDMLRRWGFHILRFSNDAVVYDLSGVLTEIITTIGNLRSS